MIISEFTNLDLNDYQYDDRPFNINAIPVVENSRINSVMVSINDLFTLTEDYGCSYEEAFCGVAEANQIDPENLAVVVEDWKIIETPELVDFVPNIVIKPISEANLAYRFVDECISEYCNTEDDQYLYNIIDEDNGFVQKHIKNGAKIGTVLGTLGGAFIGRKAGGSAGATAGGAAAGAALGALAGGRGGLEVAKRRANFNQKMYNLNQKASLGAPVSGNVVEEAKKKDPSWISKKIAAIRHWIDVKLNRNKDPKKQGMIQKLKAKLLGIIDKLKEILHLKSKSKN